MPANPGAIQQQRAAAAVAHQPPPPPPPTQPRSQLRSQPQPVVAYAAPQQGSPPTPLLAPVTVDVSPPPPSRPPAPSQPSQPSQPQPQPQPQPEQQLLEAQAAAEATALAAMSQQMREMASQLQHTSELEESKQELEGQVSKMQQTLRSVNRHLEDEQRRAAAAEAAFQQEKDELRAGAAAHEAALRAGEAEAAALQAEAERLRGVAAQQAAAHTEEKRGLNRECAAARAQVQALEAQLDATCEELRQAGEERDVAKGWLDRGVQECSRVGQEAEDARQRLAQTAAEWEDDHCELTARFDKLQAEYIEAAQERGALAVNLAAARARVVDDSRSLHGVATTLQRLGEKCAGLEAALAAGSAEAVASLVDCSANALDAPVPPPQPATSSDIPQSAQQVRAYGRDLYARFDALLATAGEAVRRWQQERELTQDLPRKIQEAQAERAGAREVNERLKLKLNELRAEGEAWRQKATSAEALAAGDPYTTNPLTQHERLTLVQAQGVAAGLYREKQGLQREADRHRQENEGLQANAGELEEENRVMKAEIQRLRAMVLSQAQQMDDFKPRALHGDRYR